MREFQVGDVLELLPPSGPAVMVVERVVHLYGEAHYYGTYLVGLNQPGGYFAAGRPAHWSSDENIVSHRGVIASVANLVVLEAADA